MVATDIASVRLRAPFHVLIICNTPFNAFVRTKIIGTIL